MENAENTPVFNADTPVKYDVSLAHIEKLKEQYLPLTVSGVDDKEGYEKCKTARKGVKDLRIKVEKRRKELKEDSLAYGKMVDSKAKELSEPLKEIEAHLQSQERIIDDEKKRIKEEEERKKREQVEARMKALAMVGYHNLSMEALAIMPEEQYQQILIKATEEKHEKEKEEEERRAKLAALEKERAENEAKIRAQEEENRRLKQEALERERKENERLQREAEEKAREARKAEEAKARAEAEAKAKEEARLAAEREKERKEQEEREAREREAQQKIADEKMFAAIKAEFSTLESAWTEIARLRKLLDEGCENV